MILRFLRLFSAFRALEDDRDATVAQIREALQEESTQKLLLQDRLDAVMNDRSELWRMMETAIENERATLQMQVNFTAQQKFGVTPFPDAVHLPASEPADTTPIKGYRTPSRRMAVRRAQFVDDYVKSHSSATQ